MRIPVGLILVVVGVILLVIGIQAADSFSSSVSKFFTGNATDRAIWFTMGGVVCIVAGLGTAGSQLLLGKRA